MGYRAASGLSMGMVLAMACSSSDGDVFDGDDDGGSGGGSGGSTLFTSANATGAQTGVTASTGTAMYTQPCHEDVECPAGEVCNDAFDACGPPGAEGTPCHFDDDCAGGHCNSKLDSCLAPGPPGTPCFFDSDCLSLLCGDSDVCT